MAEFFKEQENEAGQKGNFKSGILALKTQQVALQTCWPSNRFRRPLNVAKSGRKKRVIRILYVYKSINLWCSFPFRRQVYADEAKWKISKKSNKQLKSVFHTPRRPTKFVLGGSVVFLFDFSTYHSFSMSSALTLPDTLASPTKSKWLNTLWFAYLIYIHTPFVALTTCICMCLCTPFVARSRFLNGN